jgi:hypothetical protein
MWRQPDARPAIFGRVLRKAGTQPPDRQKQNQKTNQLLRVFLTLSAVGVKSA